MACPRGRGLVTGRDTYYYYYVVAMTPLIMNRGFFPGGLQNSPSFGSKLPNPPHFPTNPQFWWALSPLTSEASCLWPLPSMRLQLAANQGAEHVAPS